MQNVLRTFWSFLFCCALLIGSTIVRAGDRPQQLEGVGITEHLGNQLSMSDLRFLDEEGAPVTLSRYFDGKKPVILTLVYYQCPMLCNLVLNGLTDTLKKVDWSVGDQYQIVTLSINPKESPQLAKQKKESYLKNYSRSKATAGWHFLTGDEGQIQTLASEIGFNYRYDPEEKQYIHAAAIFVLTPEGKISRYLYGTSFKPQNLKLALLEASNGKIGLATLDRVLLFCFHFDPSKNSYTLSVWRSVQVVVCIQVLVLAILMRVLWKKERIRPTKSD